MNQWLPRSPAHETLHPHAATGQPLTADKAALVHQWSGLEGKVLRIPNKHHFPAGYFLVQDDKKKYFVKIIEAWYAPQLESADRMAAFAKTHGLKVSSLLPGFPRACGGNHSLFAYPYIDGSFTRHEPQELALLGSALARLHHVLRQCPWREEIRHAAVARQQMLFNRLQQIQQGQHSGIPAAAASLLHQANINQLDILYTNAQVIHGDLNAGNIMFPRQNPQPVFLDFEDSQTAWFSPLMDLAFVIERFVLVSPSASEAAGQLLQAYYRGGGNRLETAHQLSRILQALAIRALLLLAEKAARQENNQPAINPDEWRKFITLYNAAPYQSKQLSSLITQLHSG